MLVKGLKICMNLKLFYERSKKEKILEDWEEKVIHG